MTAPLVLEGDQTWVEVPYSGERARVEWIAAFLTAQSKLPKIGKDTTVTVPTKDGGKFSYRYATLPDILEAVSPVLRKEGLVLNQSVESNGDHIGVETRIYHKAGHVETFGPVLIKVAGDAKAAGSAITYARRYALCAALGIAPDEDDDGQAASREPAEMSPWRWLWNESAVFKAWDNEQRLSAIGIAVESLAITSGDQMTREEADRVWSHIQGQYESAEQGELPV